MITNKECRSYKNVLRKSKIKTYFSKGYPERVFQYRRKKIYKMLSELETSCGVYALINTKNGKMYVGSTANFKNRCSGHYTTLESKTHDSKSLQIDFDLGATFSFSVLKEVSKELLVKTEIEIIRELRKTKDLYNVLFNLEILCKDKVFATKKPLTLGNKKLVGRGGELKKLRVSKDIRQRELANILRCNVKTIGRLERNDSVGNTHILEKAFDYLNFLP